MKLIQHSLELYRENGVAWNTLGVAYYRQGSLDKALEALEESMRLREGGDSFDWFFVAMVHCRQGNEAEARRRFDEATTWMDANKPDDTELHRFRAEAEALLNDIEPADEKG